MTQKRYPLLTLLLVFSFSNLLIVSAKAPITAEKLSEMKRVGTPEVSPDGRTSALVVTQFDLEQNISSSFIYLMDNANCASGVLPE